MSSKVVLTKEQKIVQSNASFYLNYLNTKLIASLAGIDSVPPCRYGERMPRVSPTTPSRTATGRAYDQIRLYGACDNHSLHALFLCSHVTKAHDLLEYLQRLLAEQPRNEHRIKFVDRQLAAIVLATMDWWADQ
ncbi:hypothetical protein GALMADRAFT_148188 [Galerina marginata CBS 339.88]|uniref:Uncharacterized protein n=1 Tax=Galerina marginata (strain CBS 339.88) TaxID=685588 RepID=A0A067SGZ6_GALM3|nr:hypothetical protein GALMADRAFT_148188 [Galerina marginata CBS 339.88]